MKYCLIFFFLFSIITIRGRAFEQDTIVLQGKNIQVTCDGKETYFFSDLDLPIQKIRTEKFKKKKDIDLFYITGWVWVKFTIKNESEKEQFIFNMTDGHLSGVYMYKPTSTGYEMTPPKLHHPEDGRELFTRLPSFIIELKKGESQTYYIKINTENEVVNFSYILNDRSHFIKYMQADYMILGLYFGVLLTIIIINIFYFYSLKDSIFLIYSVYVLGNFLFTATLDGFTWLLLPGPDIAYHISFFCIRFWNDSMLFFIIRLVNLKKYNKTLTTICYAFIFYHAFLMPLFCLVPSIREQCMGQWEGLNWMICVVLALTAIIRSKNNNKHLIKFYFVLFFILILVFTFFIILHTNKGDHYLVFEHGMKVGMLLEIITLSFAISRKFRLTEDDLKKKKEEEQQLNKKVKQLEMDVRKAQMNPHFMFNALTSIEYFIFKNDSQKARNYLNKFAQMMRLTLDNSRNNYIPLKDELNALKFYIELEFLRLKNYPHNFKIEVGDTIDQENVLVPALLIQPFVENAIWHGLQKKETAGKLLVSITFHEQELRCVIDDDGGGMDKTAAPTNRKSSGIVITKERLILIHTILKTPYKFDIENLTDKLGGTIGTSIQFNLPHIHKD